MDTSAIGKAGISHYSLDGSELWLFHGGASRKYDGIDTDAKLKKAIAEFKANVPALGGGDNGHTGGSRP